MTANVPMGDSPTRAHLRRELQGHLTRLGYSSARSGRAGTCVPEFVRVNPVRGRIAYGETVLRSDLSRPSCHERLICFSQRRTRSRTTILFFIGVAEADKRELEKLLERLEIRSSTRGGHVHVVPIATPAQKGQRKPPRGRCH